MLFISTSNGNVSNGHGNSDGDIYMHGWKWHSVKITRCTLFEKGAH